jgi:hypothetical protein
LAKIVLEEMVSTGAKKRGFWDYSTGYLVLILLPTLPIQAVILWFLPNWAHAFCSMLQTLTFLFKIMCHLCDYGSQIGCILLSCEWHRGSLWNVLK